MKKAVNTRTITGIWLVLLVVSSANGQTLPSIANLQLRLTADSGTSTTVDGAGVADWFDTAHSHFFFNANDTLPTYVADSGGGVPAIDFERSSGFLGDFSASAGSTISDATIFVIARFDGYTHAASSSSYFFSIDNFADPGIPDTSEHTLGRDSSTLGPDQLYHWRGQPSPEAAYGTNILEDQPGTPFGDFNYYTAIFRGADDGGGSVNEMEAWINGSSGATLTPDVTHNGSGYNSLPSETRIGLWTSNGSGLDGMIREVLIYNRVLNSQEITDVEDYLAQRSQSPVAPTLLLQVDRDNLNVIIKNVSGANLDLSGYLAASASGAFDRTSWTSIAGTYDQDSGGTVDPNNVWQEQGSASDNTLEESANSGFATLAPNQEIALGPTWTPYFAEDVTFEFTDGSGAVVIAPVQFSGNGGNPFPFGDLDFNGSVGTEDWTALINGYGQDLTGKSVAAAYGLGDLTGDGNHSLADIQSFRTAFVAAGGALSELTGWPVPEPASAALLLFAAGLPTFRSRKRIRRTLGGGKMLTNLHMERLPCAVAVAGVLLSLAARSAVAALPPVTSGTLVAQFDADPLYLSLDGGGADVASWTAANDNSIVLSRTGAAASNSNILFDANELAGGGAVVVNDFLVDGTHDNLVLQGAIPGTRTASTVFFLGYFSPGRDGSLGDGSGQYLYSYGASGGAGTQIDFQIDDGNAEIWGGGGTQGVGDISARNGEYTVYRIESGGGAGDDFAVYVDGTLLGGGNEGANYNVNGDLILFGWQNSSGVSGGFNFVGNVGQLLFYDGNLDNADVDAVESYLASLKPSELTLSVNINSGELLFNGGDISRDINGYEIRSAAGSLDPTAWLASNFDAQNLDPVGAGTGVGESWDTFTSSTTRLTESFLLGSSLFDVNRSESLGISYNTAVDARDLTFEYTDTAGNTRLGVIEYIDTVLDGDFDFDGDRDGDDFLVWQRDHGDALNLALWESNYGVPAAGSAGASAVPEPSAAILLFLGFFGCSSRRRRGQSGVDCLNASVLE